MSGRWIELMAGPFRASWRAGLGWGLAFAAFIVSTIAFWPAFRESPALSSGLQDMLELLPPSMLEAFGMEDFDTAAGYLRGGLYEVLVPLMFAAAGVMLASSAMAGEEDAGRLELLLAQPVTRQALFLGRVAAVLAWLVVLGAVVLVSQLGSDAVFGLEIGTDRIVATIALCTLLGVVHAALGLAIAGIAARPSAVLAIGFGVVLTGYVVAALFPLSDVLRPWRQVSPWDWAIGGNPLVGATEAWRYAALVLPAVVLVALGLVAFVRRDVRSA